MRDKIIRGFRDNDVSVIFDKFEFFFFSFFLFPFDDRRAVSRMDSVYIYIYIYNLPVDTLSISVINIVRDRMKLCYDNSV